MRKFSEVINLRDVLVYTTSIQIQENFTTY